MTHDYTLKVTSYGDKEKDIMTYKLIIFIPASISIYILQKLYSARKKHPYKISPEISSVCER